MSNTEVVTLHEDWERWRKLVRQCVNFSGKETKVVLASEIFPITISEVLDIGYFALCPPAVVIKDTEGKLWFIRETHEPGGLVSRHSLRPGTRLRMEVRESAWIGKETAVFLED